MKSTIRRSQGDYSLAFKLSVVDQVERGELTYKRPRSAMGFKIAARCLPCFADMVGKTGRLEHHFLP
ncbi:TPA: hypothetical protein ACG4N6_002187 [Stenotrophomonas maltophilia]|jgi:hypothetical protein|nr:hypothetical protein [Stenotrophomonas maltophilia]